jgi:hypothetical protein
MTTRTKATSWLYVDDDPKAEIRTISVKLDARNTGRRQVNDESIQGSMKGFEEAARALNRAFSLAGFHAGGDCVTIHTGDCKRSRSTVQKT